MQDFAEAPVIFIGGPAFFIRKTAADRIITADLVFQFASVSRRFFCFRHHLDSGVFQKDCFPFSAGGFRLQTVIVAVHGVGLVFLFVFRQGAFLLRTALFFIAAACCAYDDFRLCFRLFQCFSATRIQTGVSASASGAFRRHGILSLAGLTALPHTLTAGLISRLRTLLPGLRLSLWTLCILFPARLGGGAGFAFGTGLLFLLPVFFSLSARLLSAGTLSLSVSRVSAVASGTVALAFFFSLSILLFLL